MVVVVVVVVVVEPSWWSNATCWDGEQTLRLLILAEAEVERMRLVCGGDAHQPSWQLPRAAVVRGCALPVQLLPMSAQQN